MNVLLFSCLWFLSSCSQMVDSTSRSIILDVHNASYSAVIRTDTISIDSALVRWHTDTLGCLGQRTVVLARELMTKLKIMNKRQDEIIQLFGKPNEIYYQDLYVGNIQKDGTFLVLRYYTEQECIDGRPTDQNMGHVSIHIIIDLTTNRVVDYS